MCTDKDLIEIAKQLPNWELTISNELSYPVAEVNEIRYDNPKYRAQKIDALLRWKEKEDCFATYSALATIFRNSDNVHLAEEVEKIALKGKISA